MKIKQLLVLMLLFGSTLLIRAQQLNTVLRGNDSLPGEQNTIIGNDAGVAITTINDTVGALNVFVGVRAGNRTTIGQNNVFLGYQTGFANLTGNSNSFLGRSAGYGNEIGHMNAYTGFSSGYAAKGNRNTFNGANSGYRMQGSNNVCIGYRTGYGMFATDLSGSGNVFIGNEVGYSNGFISKNNQLAIHNSDVASPLIYGEFGTVTPVTARKLRFNVNNHADSRVEIAAMENRSGLKFENLKSTTTLLAPSSGKVLTVDNDGNVVLTTDANDGSGTNTAWSLTGNAGTVPGTNFIGTTGNEDLIFKRNNTISGQIGTTTTSFGYEALPVNTGLDNTAIGKNALKLNTVGINNTALGSNALATNLGGNSNTALGAAAMSESTGDYNVAIGNSAGKRIKSSYNVIIGSEAGLKYTSSNIPTGNIFIGAQSGYNNVSGKANVFLGHRSGFNELGSNKLYISNSDISNPLIHGEFDAKKLKFNVDGSAESKVIIKSFNLGISGLNLANLTAGDEAPVTTNNKFLSVSNDGDVVLHSLPVSLAEEKNIYTHDGHLINTATTAGLRTVYLDNSNLAFNTQGTTDNEKGKIYIGSNPNFPTTTGNYRLYVEGGILTEKAKVALRNASHWADYVFANDYKLMPLNEIETFVKENKHLPGIESAEELVQKGLDLGEMQAKQMGKIEELTLYVIEQNKTLEKQTKEIEELKAMVKFLINKI